MFSYSSKSLIALDEQFRNAMILLLLNKKELPKQSLSDFVIIYLKFDSRDNQ